MKHFYTLYLHCRLKITKYIHIANQVQEMEMVTSGVNNFQTQPTRSPPMRVEC